MDEELLVTRPPCTKKQARIEREKEARKAEERRERHLLFASSQSPPREEKGLGLVCREHQS